MAVLPMKRVSICGLKNERKLMLEELQRKEVIEISNMTSKEKAFYKEESAQMAEKFRKKIAIAQNALEIINQYAPEKKPLLAMLDGRKEVGVKQYESFSLQRDQVYKEIAKIVALSKEIAEHRSEQQKLDLMATALTPWEQLDVPLNETGTRTTSLFIGTLPGLWNQEKVETLLANAGPSDVHIISIQGELTCITALVTKKKSDLAFETLRANGFARPTANCQMAPREQLQEYAIRNEILARKIKQAEDEIIESAKNREDILFFIDYETMRAEKYEQIGHLLMSRHTFILTGYIAEKDAKVLKDNIESKYIATVEIMEPDQKEDVPVILKNNGFASPLESVTIGYAAPNKGEMDSTFVMSLFYYMLFGIMFSDAGYGLVLALVCGILLCRHKNMEAGFRNLLLMFLYCGIATVFWGFIFGSFFGDSVTVIAKNFFNADITFKPMWFSPNDYPMKMLVFSMVLGIVHLMTGLVMKMANCIKNKQYKDAIYDVVFWMVLVISSILVLMSSQTFVDIIGAQNQKLSAGVGKAAGILAGLSAFGIVLTSGRESKNWFKRILKGIYGLYGITGYLSDILSYSRLLALGLATGVIGAVVNSIGVMPKNLFAKAVLFIIVFMIGHVLNFLINILGAYVHTNRLQYVEFFGKFYEGGGRMFTPFSGKTKYYIVKEDKNG